MKAVQKEKLESGRIINTAMQGHSKGELSGGELATDASVARPSGSKGLSIPS